MRWDWGPVEVVSRSSQWRASAGIVLWHLARRYGRIIQGKIREVWSTARERWLGRFLHSSNHIGLALNFTLHIHDWLVVSIGLE